ncbi:hypothetical protein TNCV_2624721 [Trichonephila clavipes]|nr:hypothetical protein TNCV_2624721 [Trichonephila clavipes]
MLTRKSSTFSDPEKYTSGKTLNPAAPPTSGLGVLNLVGRHCKAGARGVCPTSILSSRPRDVGVNEEPDVAKILISLY